MTGTNNVGISIPSPSATCEDKNCPFHGNLKVHGRQHTGVVVSAKMNKTITVSWERRIYVPKYERYERKISKVQAHSPACIGAKEGDVVKIMECRPLSKLKTFVVIKVEEEAKQ